jgi:hypothetical protein
VPPLIQNSTSKRVCCFVLGSRNRTAEGVGEPRSVSRVGVSEANSEPRVLKSEWSERVRFP